MSCTLSITGVTLDPVTGNISVQGHYGETQPCGAGPNITVIVQCGPVTFSGSGEAILGTSLWEATFAAPCNCDFPATISVVANCPGINGPPFSCTATYTTNNLC